ncbi:MAG TPA: hypothetical protein VK571_06425 [Gemmatimonadaceae bacterium]|nr:hypothetical protein [Gemmatimonadaceae bacterium]
MCEGTDWEPTVTAEVTRRARKAHRCAECRKIIAPGTSYVRCSSLTDGHWGDWAACHKCHAVERAHAAAEHSMNGNSSYYVGQLLETVRECIREEPHYVVAFRAAWKGEPVPKKPPTPSDRSRYPTVMG